MTYLRTVLQAAVLLVFILPNAIAAEQPAATTNLKVVASIMPVHSLVIGVMKGVAEPKLLVSGNASPHRFAMRPSQARVVANADVIFWIGGAFETFLKKSISKAKGKSVELLNAPGVQLLKAREGGVWEVHAHGHRNERKARKHDHTDHKDEHQNAALDGHMWLDPRNGHAMVGAIVQALSKADPVHASRYSANGRSVQQRLETLEKQLSAMLDPVRENQFIVFHDAFQYFENRFNLSGVGSVLVHSGHAPSAKRLYQIRKKVLGKEAICLFREPQFAPKMADRIVSGTQAQIGTLDPLGAGVEAGPEAYFNILRMIGNSMAACLKGR